MNKSFLEEKITIKNIEVPRLMSAPMDGITDSPMRRMIRMFSKDELLYSQMRHVAYLANAKDKPCLRYNKIEHPVCFQISTNSTNFIPEALEKILAQGFDMINLNAGCPARNNIKAGCGAALMANPKNLKDIILTIKESIPTNFPFTVKMRSGFKEKNAKYIAKMCQDLGVDALIVHPRTQREGFGLGLDFDLVKKIKESVQIPVMFSGNIVDFATTQETYNNTGVDGFMIGRALWGTPWKMHEIMQNAAGKEFVLSTKEILELVKKHLQLNVDFYDEQAGVKLFKYHLAKYIKHLPNALPVKNPMLMSETHKDMVSVINKLIEQET